jgi:K+ transporter
VYGVASLIVLVVLVKYVALIMRADNDGEGGIMALVSLIVRERRGDRMARRLVLLGIVGAARVALDVHVQQIPRARPFVAADLAARRLRRP